MDLLAEVVFVSANGSLRHLNLYHGVFSKKRLELLLEGRACTSNVGIARIGSQRVLTDFAK